MKKALLILSLLLVFILTGCNKNNEVYVPSQNNNVPVIEAPSEKGYGFVLKNTEIHINDSVAPIVTALGEPSNYFESNSCAYQGLDKVYTYGSVIIRTYPDNGDDYVLSIELKDDSVSTPEGVSIGNTLEFAQSVYGNTVEKTATSLIYRKGDSVLTFISKNDEIYSITYTQNTQAE